MLRDKLVGLCLLAAVLVAFGHGLWNPGRLVEYGASIDSVFWLWRLSWIAPYALALVAVVGGGRPGSALLVAGSALVATLFAVDLYTGLDKPTAGISLAGVAAYFLNIVAIVPADFAAAAWHRRFDRASGAATGLVCGLVLAAVAFLWALPRVVDVPTWYVLGGYVFPPLVMSAVGAVTGAFAAGARHRSLVDG